MLRPWLDQGTFPTMKGGGGGGGRKKEKEKKWRVDGEKRIKKKIYKSLFAYQKFDLWGRAVVSLLWLVAK